MLSTTFAPALADALRRADFTVDTVGLLLGVDAHRALLRNETTAARRATADGSPTATLARLFLLQLAVSRDAADRALPGLVDELADHGLLRTSVSEVAAAIDIRPYGDETHDWWVACDLTPGLDGQGRHVTTDHVLGISEASSSLAQLTVRQPIRSALDLGAGCGVQSLHLSTHADRVVATDVNTRALWMSRLTGALNGVDLDVRDGSLFEPVAGERFDMIATNPPFVVSPPDQQRYVYRDSGLPGDEVVRRVVTGARDHLNPGGWCQILANWIHREDQSWIDRVADWVGPTGLDAWVLQREVADLPTYVEMWLADAGQVGMADYVRQYDAWLSWFESQGIEGIGFGWLSLYNAGRDEPSVLIEEWPYEIEQPLGPHIASWSARADALAGATDDDLLRRRLTHADALVQESAGPVGAADPEHIRVRMQRGVRRAEGVDTVEAGLIGACDGELTVGQILDALAQLLDRDQAELRATYVPRVRQLVARGFLS